MDRPTIKRKEREREARREAILEAASRVFSRKSYYEATIDEIAAEAELAKGTLYNYYRDKQDIFLSLLERGLDQFQQILDQAIASGGTLSEVLTKCFQDSLRIFRDHQYMFRMMVTAGNHLSVRAQAEIVENWHNQSMIAAHKLAEALAAMPESAKLSPADRLTGAELVFTAVHALHHRLMFGDATRSLDEETENFVRLLCRALTVE